MNKLLKIWDFTFNFPKDQKAEDINPNHMADILKEIATDWCFQLEKGEKCKRLHYQGRFRLKVKKRIGTLINCFDEYTGIHFSPTSNENRKNNFYVCKEETRVDGPWSSADRWIPDNLLTKDMLYKWQQQVISICSEQLQKGDDRSVNVITNPGGNLGKSGLMKYLIFNYNAHRLYLLEKAEDMLQQTFGKLTAKGQRDNIVFIVDIPKATSRHEMKKLLYVLEILKDGQAFDKRYSWKEYWFNSPVIWVFTNQELPMHLLSEDRWKLFKVVNNELQKADDDPTTPPTGDSLRSDITNAKGGGASR
jgi:hypothetical protein